MSDRITGTRIRNVLEHYATCLVSTGVCTPEQVKGLCMASPYGQVRYVCRYVNGSPLHDVPGFLGSSSGFVTMREVYNAVQQSKATLYQALDTYSIAHRVRMAEDDAQRAAEWEAEKAARAEVSA
jgi:hypothetical protein